MKIINEKGFSLIKFMKFLIIGFIILGVLLFVAYKVYMKWEYAALEASASAYVEGASNAIITHMMSNTKIRFKGTCQVYEDKLNCPNIDSLEQTLLQVYVKGNLPVSGTITFTETGTVEKAELIIRENKGISFFIKNQKIICDGTICHKK